MDFSFTSDQLAIRAAIEKICANFDADYWLDKDNNGGFPLDFHAALARDGCLGVAMTERFGSAGLVVTVAALMMETNAQSGAGMSGASAVHMDIFELNRVVVFGSDV